MPLDKQRDIFSSLLMTLILNWSSSVVSSLEFQLVNPTTQVSLFSRCFDDCPTAKNITWNIFQGFNRSSTNIRWQLFTQIDQLNNIWFFGKLSFRSFVWNKERFLSGRNTSHFTALSELFGAYPQIRYWRFQVVDTFPTEISSSALNFEMNESPANGSCSIFPLNGSTSTLFSVSCPQWTDQDGIEDYSLYNTSLSRLTIVAVSSVSQFSARLSTGKNENSSTVNLIVHIRDTLDCVTSLNLSSVVVTTDLSIVNHLLNFIDNPSSTNPSIQLLNTGNENIVSQLISSFSQQFNRMSSQLVDEAQSSTSTIFSSSLFDSLIVDGIPRATISFPSLTDPISSSTVNVINRTALEEFIREQNHFSLIREHLMQCIMNLSIGTAKSIHLQSSSLVQLTQTTNELTRTSCVSHLLLSFIVSLIRTVELDIGICSMFSFGSFVVVDGQSCSLRRCFKCRSSTSSMCYKRLHSGIFCLSVSLSLFCICLRRCLDRCNNVRQCWISIILGRMSFSMITKPILNLLGRIQVRNSEKILFSSIFVQLDLFADGDDFSLPTIEKNRNRFFHEQLSIEISRQSDETIDLLTNALNVHLNIEQNISFHNPNALMSLGMIPIGSLSDQILSPLISNGSIRLPRMFFSDLSNNNSDVISFRVRQLIFARWSLLPSSCVKSLIQHLAPLGRSAFATNLSRLMSLSLFDEDEKRHVSVQTSETDPIELFIPRDVHLDVPPMSLENVTRERLFFSHHWIHLTLNFSFSLHIQIRPIKTNLTYLFLFRFDQMPQFTRSTVDLDGWSLFCPSSELEEYHQRHSLLSIDLSDEGLYEYFLDNHRTKDHRSLIIALRELNSTEAFNCCHLLPSSNLSCLPKFDEPIQFTSNYYLRVYTSGCFYLDSNRRWQSDGLMVINSLFINSSSYHNYPFPVGPLTNLRQTQCFSTHIWPHLPAN